MGLTEKKGSITYVNIKNGLLAIKESDGTIKLFESVTGHLTNIEFKDDEYNGKKFEKLCLTLEDGQERFLLQFRLDSGYARGFMFAIGNCDLSNPLELAPSSKQVNGKPQTTIFVKQNSKAIKWVWTKDHPGNMPQLETKTFKGDILYDNSKQLAFLKDMLMNEIKPQLGKKEDGWDKLKEIAKKNEQPASIDDVADDLPF